MRGIFFDLDGTLLDTAPDLHQACCEVLQQYQLPPIALTEFCHYISAGTDAIICASFGIDCNNIEFVTIKNKFLFYYRRWLIQKTQLFPGIIVLLDWLDKQNLSWGIVTGKPSDLTIPLLEHFNLRSRSQCLVTGDTVSPGKPHPAPLLYACDLLDLQPAHCFYVGDAKTDIIAANAAGMKSVAVTYGYCGIDRDPYTWRAYAVVRTPTELMRLLSTYLKSSRLTFSG